MIIHEEALYQVYVPLHVPFTVEDAVLFWVHSYLRRQHLFVFICTVYSRNPNSLETASVKLLAANITFVAAAVLTLKNRVTRDVT